MVPYVTNKNWSWKLFLQKKKNLKIKAELDSAKKKIDLLCRLKLNRKLGWQ